MHCCCSSGSAHCVLQAFAFVRQFVSQSSASLNLYSPVREKSPAGDGAPPAIMSAPKMQVVSRKVFMDAFQRRVLEWIRPALEFRMFRPVFSYHIGRPEGMTVTSRNFANRLRFHAGARRQSRARLPQSKSRRERRAGDRDQGQGAKDQKRGCEGDHRTRPRSRRRDAENQNRHAKRQNQNREQ